MTARTARPGAPPALAAARDRVAAPMRAAVEHIPDARMRRIAGYQLGWWDADGVATAEGQGKTVRPALVLLASRAVSGSADPGVPAGVAVELVHNFSLLHDDIMDRDVERRHRPTGWVTFGEGQAILAGNAMLAAAVDTLVREDPRHERTVPLLLAVVQQLISGQSADLALEGDESAELDDVLAMEEGKTAALLAGSLALGAAAAGAEPAVERALSETGRLLGLAFQLVDDVLGIVGNSAVTGKSASSDVRAGKRSAPVVAALRSGTTAGDELGTLLRDGAPQTEAEVDRAVELVTAAGGIEWARSESGRLLDRALAELRGAALVDATAVGELVDVARFLVQREW